MITTIKKSAAYDNPFFQRCRSVTALTPDQLRPLARNWREVTRSFWLATCRLVGMLGDQADTTLLPPLLKIAAEDAGLFGGAVDGRQGPPHYLLWQDLCDSLAVNWETEPEPETVALIQAFTQMNDVRTGLAMVIVVEAVAYEIIDATRSAFQAAGIVEQRPGYLTLHRSLEIEHARDMGEVAKLIDMDLTKECANFCGHWANFWSAMHRVTFGKD
ncbi:MAG: iron-containing redox enzyme family protein [bacterium]|nr:iron-containing redox enzyme family protein [bacterium]